MREWDVDCVRDYLCWILTNDEKEDEGDHEQLTKRRKKSNTHASRIDDERTSHLFQCLD